MKVNKLLTTLVVAMVAFFVQAQDMSDDAIAERIKPLGSVHVSGNDGKPTAAAGARSGEDIYNKACVACHAAGVLGAPVVNVAADWQPRIDERGLKGIWQNAISGYNAMPPMGTCADCSEDEIKSAIQYMVKDI